MKPFKPHHVIMHLYALLPYRTLYVFTDKIYFCLYNIVIKNGIFFSSPYMC